MKKTIVSLFFILSSFASAEPLKVVVSIKPIYALVQGIMGEAGDPKLLIKENASPHHFSFTPSQAQLINQADLIIWVGPDLEEVLSKPLEKFAQGKVVTLMQVEGLKKHEYDNGRVDPHIWLSPENAIVMVQYLQELLSNKDPDNKEIYKTNAEQLSLKISVAAEQIKEKLKDSKDKNVFVYHDAYHYFEDYFGLKRSVPILKDAEHSLRAKRRLEIEEMTKKQTFSCIFGEPNHGKKAVDGIAAQLKLKQADLDPLGATLDGEEDNSYLAILDNIAQTYVTCTNQ